MKYLLFCLLALPLMGEPNFIQKGDAVPSGLVRFKLESPTLSMAPTMTGREVCWFEPYAGQPIKVNDFVWFIRWDGAQILHRVTSLNKRAIYTAGDANKQSDGWTAKERVRYILRVVERPAVSHLAQVR